MGTYNVNFANTDANMYDYEKNLGPHTVKSLEQKYSYENEKSDNALKGAKNYMFKYYKPSGNCMMNYFLARFPFFDWIRFYDFKQNFVKDLIAGLTVILHNALVDRNK
jgi:hypothetical protein